MYPCVFAFTCRILHCMKLERGKESWFKPGATEVEKVHLCVSAFTRNTQHTTLTDARLDHNCVISVRRDSLKAAGGASMCLCIQVRYRTAPRNESTTNLWFTKVKCEAEQQKFLSNAIHWDFSEVTSITAGASQTAKASACLFGPHQWYVQSKEHNKSRTATISYTNWHLRRASFGMSLTAESSWYFKSFLF